VNSGNQQRIVNIGKSKAALPVYRQKNVEFSQKHKLLIDTILY